MKFAGSSSYPDATGTLRLSSGAMLGWTANGRAVAPLTTLAQALAVENGSGGRVPPRWLDAKDRITGTASLNIAVDADIGGGCAGCAILSAPGDLVGVVIGGNRESAAGRYWFDGASRAVGLDAAAIKELLLKVYRTDDLMKEMVIAR